MPTLKITLEDFIHPSDVNKIIGAIEQMKGVSGVETSDNSAQFGGNLAHPTPNPSQPYYPPNQNQAYMPPQQPPQYQGQMPPQQPPQYQGQMPPQQPPQYQAYTPPQPPPQHNVPYGQPPQGFPSNPYDEQQFQQMDPQATGPISAEQQRKFISSALKWGIHNGKLTLEQLTKMTPEENIKVAMALTDQMPDQEKKRLADEIQNI